MDLDPGSGLGPLPTFLRLWENYYTFWHLGSPVCERRLLRPTMAMLQSYCESSMEGVFGMPLAKLLPSEAGERGSCLME